ncbi:MAG: hypothetical protein WD739_03970 [Actinomycetota bacterium]
MASAGVSGSPGSLIEAKLAPRLEATLDSTDPSIQRVPVSEGGFLGVDDRLEATPAWSTGALGQSWFVSAVNAHIGVFPAGGGAVRPGWPVRLRVFEGALPAGAVESSPRVVYDAYADRFVLAFVGQDKASKPTRSWIVLATVRDADADDPDAWCVRRVAGDQTKNDGEQRPAAPALGFTGDRVTVATDQRGMKGTKFHYAQVLSFAKGQLYGSCGKLAPKVFANEKTRDPNRERGVGLQPVQTVGGTSPNVQYLVSFQGTARGDRLVLWRIRKTAGGYKLARVSRKVPSASVAPYGTQRDGGIGDPDTFWDTGDLRLGPSWFDVDTNRISTAHAVARAAGDASYVESAIRWYQLRPEPDLTSSAVSGQGSLFVEDRDLAWPAVATTASGTIVITHSRAGVLGGGQFLSAYATDVVGGVVDGTTLLRAGEARYQAGQGPDPWGGSNAANRDPSAPSRVAVANQFAISDGGGATALWHQWLDVLDPA